MAPVIKVAVLSGSLRKASRHKGLIRAAIELSKGGIEGVEIEFIDISALPMLNTDLENKGIYPPPVEAFRCKILQADSVLFASPEYNYSVSEETRVAMSRRSQEAWEGLDGTRKRWDNTEHQD